MFPSRQQASGQYTDIDIFLSKILKKNVNCQTGLLVLLPPVQSIYLWQVVGEERLKCIFRAVAMMYLPQLNKSLVRLSSVQFRSLLNSSQSI